MRQVCLIWVTSIGAFVPLFCDDLGLLIYRWPAPCEVFGSIAGVMRGDLPYITRSFEVARAQTALAAALHLTPPQGQPS